MPPTRINSVVTGQQFFASIAVNTDGVIAVIYYSTQNSPTDRLIDVYKVVSIDGGTTFSVPIRVTNFSFDRPQTNPNFDNNFGPCYMGDYISITAPAPGLGDTGFYMAWGDNRMDGDNDPGTGLQPDPDIFFERAEGNFSLGDIDLDGDVDSDDLSLLLAALNTLANGANDLRDLNGDGKINVLDARTLVTLCTRPRCATR